MDHPPLELERARLALQSDRADHGPWMGANHAQCPYCHAREQIYALGLAEPRREQAVRLRTGTRNGFMSADGKMAVPYGPQ